MIVSVSEAEKGFGRPASSSSRQDLICELSLVPGFNETERCGTCVAVRFCQIMAQDRVSELFSS